MVIVRVMGEVRLSLRKASRSGGISTAVVCVCCGKVERGVSDYSHRGLDYAMLVVYTPPLLGISSHLSLLIYRRFPDESLIVVHC